jgi:hypothetical protein
MAIRTQEQLFAIGYKPQTSALTPNTATQLVRLLKLNADIAFPTLSTEDDSQEMGKGDEFATQEFAVAWDARGKLNKYLTSQAAQWAYTFALGSFVASDAFTSTIVPQDPQSVGIELPYFSVLQQFRPNQVGGAPLDQLMVGCAMDELTIDINSGPGRQASQISTSFFGTGYFIEPSGYTMPSAVAEVQLPAASAQVVINGIDYIGNANRGRLMSLRLGVKNNFDTNSGYFIGSGSEIAGQPQSGAVRGRLEFTRREYSLSFVVRMQSSSAEFTALRNLTTGTASIGLTGDANNHITVQHPAITFKSVVLGDSNNIATLSIDCTIKKDPSLGPIVVTAKNSTIQGIGTLP